jgi:L-seryl-tRNA(Ser) seleniumtransferase
LQRAFGDRYETTAVATTSQIGSGALPIQRLPSHGIAVRAHRGASLARLEAALRALPRPVIGRVADRTLWLDLRCLDTDDEAAFLGELAQLHIGDA